MATQVASNSNNLPSVLQPEQANHNPAEINPLQLIQSQNDRIQQLEQEVIKTKVEKSRATNDLEKQLFETAEEKDLLAQQLAYSQQLLQKNQAAIEELQRGHGQDAQQIAEGLREIQILNQQMVQERQKVQLLGAQYAAALQKIDQLNDRIHEFEKLQREILDNLKQQKTSEPDLLTTLFDYARGAIWRTFNGYDPKLYQ
jgi:phage shock protein A